MVDYDLWALPPEVGRCTSVIQTGPPPAPDWLQPQPGRNNALIDLATQLPAARLRRHRLKS
jgi:hypothetical protein